MSNSARRLLPGLKPVLELLQSAPDQISRIFIKNDTRAARQILDMATQCGVAVEETDAARLEQICGGSPTRSARTSHQGVVAVLAATNIVPLREALALAATAPLPLLPALDQVQDPGNLGAIARTSWALGCPAIILPEHNSARPGPGALRASAGALAKLPLCLVPNLARALDEAEEAGLAIYGTGCDGHECASVFEFKWSLPAVLVLGSEEKGLRPGVAKRCQTMLNIPFARQFDSLNVAQAGAILMAFCAARCS